VGHEREGDKYVGNWDNDRMDLGIYFRRNGDRYEGPLRNGREHGFGVLLFGGEREGDVYRGMFKNGMRHGEGIYSHNSGESFQAEWMNGILVHKICTLRAERKRKREKEQR